MSRETVAPIIKFVRGIEGNYMTLAEVARALNVVEETLRSWYRREPQKYGPSLMTYFGGTPVYLYSLDDVERVRTNAKARGETRKGRPRLWTVREGQVRQNSLTRAGYLRRRAREMRERGEVAQAKEYEKQAAAIQRQLVREGKARRKALGR